MSRQVSLVRPDEVLTDSLPLSEADVAGALLRRISHTPERADFALLCRLYEVSLPSPAL